MCKVVWYVIQVWTGHELDIAERCRQEIIKPGEDAFVMLGERKYRVRGRWLTDHYRLFPSYVFIETDDIEDFGRRLRSIKEMTKVLATDNYKTPLHPDEEEHLRKLGGEEHIAKYSEGYIEGEELIITSGALEGYKGVIKRLDRHHRLVVITVTLMGAPVDVELGLGVVSRSRHAQ